MTFKIHMDALGLDNADAMILELQRLGASSVGVALYGRPYPESDTNTADVLRFLAEGGRPLGPSQEDADYARGVYMARVRDRLELMRYQAGQGKKIPGGQAAQAEFAQASALKMAAEAVRVRMLQRAESHSTEDGTPADSVTEEYAAWRERKYQVPESAIYKRTGLLLKSLGPGNVRVTKRELARILPQVAHPYLTRIID